MLCVAEGISKVDILFFVEMDDTVGVGYLFSWLVVQHALGTDGTVADLEMNVNSNVRAGFHVKRGLLLIDSMHDDRRDTDTTW